MKKTDKKLREIIKKAVAETVQREVCQITGLLSAMYESTTNLCVTSKTDYFRALKALQESVNRLKEIEIPKDD